MDHSGDSGGRAAVGLGEVSCQVGAQSLGVGKT